MTATELARFETFTADFQATLNPIGILEETFANEIAGAAWRLQNCTLREATLAAADPTADTEAGLIALHRARANALNLMNKATRELRLLQTERHTRNELFAAGTDLSHLGLARWKDILDAQLTQERFHALFYKAKKDHTASLNAQLEAELQAEEAELKAERQSEPEDNRAAQAPVASLCKTPPVPPAPGQLIARNSLCVCNSGRKFKRCCGVNAPAVLGRAA